MIYLLCTKGAHTIPQVRIILSSILRNAFIISSSAVKPEGLCFNMACLSNLLLLSSHYLFKEAPGGIVLISVSTAKSCGKNSYFDI